MSFSSRWYLWQNLSIITIYKLKWGTVAKSNKLPNSTKKLSTSHTTSKVWPPTLGHDPSYADHWAMLLVFDEIWSEKCVYVNYKNTMAFLYQFRMCTSQWILFARRLSFVKSSKSRLAPSHSAYTYNNCANIFGFFRSDYIVRVLEKMW